MAALAESTVPAGTRPDEAINTGSEFRQIRLLLNQFIKITIHSTDLTQHAIKSRLFSTLMHHRRKNSPAK
jgi:hypothetical protein